MSSSRFVFAKIQCLLLVLMTPCVDVLAQSTSLETSLKGEVSPGSVANEIDIRLTLRGQSTIDQTATQDLIVTLANPPELATNVRIQEDSGNSTESVRAYVVSFDVPESALPGTIETLKFEISTPDMVIFDASDLRFSYKVGSVEIELQDLSSCWLLAEPGLLYHPSTLDGVTDCTYNGDCAGATEFARENGYGVEENCDNEEAEVDDLAHVFYLSKVKLPGDGKPNIHGRKYEKNKAGVLYEEILKDSYGEDYWESSFSLGFSNVPMKIVLGSNFSIVVEAQKLLHRRDSHCSNEHRDSKIRDDLNIDLTVRSKYVLQSRAQVELTDPMCGTVGQQSAASRQQGGHSLQRGFSSTTQCRYITRTEEEVYGNLQYKYEYECTAHGIDDNEREAGNIIITWPSSERGFFTLGADDYWVTELIYHPDVNRQLSGDVDFKHSFDLTTNQGLQNDSNPEGEPEHKAQTQSPNAPGADQENVDPQQVEKSTLPTGSALTNPANVDNSARVAEVIGQNLLNARKNLEAQGLNVKVSDGPPAPTDALEGTVVRVVPKPGTGLAPGDSVELIIYSTAYREVTIPNVVGKIVDDAQRILIEAGLVVEIAVTKTEVSAANMNAVNSVNPAPGTLVKPGTKVVLGVYQAQSGSIDDLDEAESSLFGISQSD